VKAPLKSGIAAISRAGRDKGRVYVVLCELDADFVTVCDGRLRPLERPKKKRRKHLLSTHHEMASLPGPTTPAAQGNHEIRKFLESLNDPDPHDPA